jgi:hypothetical protein
MDEHSEVDATGRVVVDDQEFLQGLFDAGVVPQNAGGDAAVPDRSFFDETVYVG